MGYADMHDEDKKEVTIEGTAMKIRPSGNEESWEVEAEIDVASCSALIDFNVPGKPSPPPVKLSASLWVGQSASAHEMNTEFEFTDPSGTLAASDSVQAILVLPQTSGAMVKAGQAPLALL